MEAPHTRVLVRMSEGKAQEYVLPHDKVAIVGRNANADLPIILNHISSKQCTLTPPDDPKAPVWRLQDFSSNGTLLNGTYVGQNRAVPLAEGDVLTFSPRDPYPCIIFSPPSVPDGVTVAPPVAKRPRVANDAKGALEARMEKQRKELAAAHEALAALREQVEAKDAQLIEAEEAAAREREEAEARLRDAEARATAAGLRASAEAAAAATQLMAARDEAEARCARLEAAAQEAADAEVALLRRVREAEEAARVCAERQAASEARVEEVAAAVQRAHEELHEARRRASSEEAARLAAERRAEERSVELAAAMRAASARAEEADAAQSGLKPLRAEVAALRQASLEQAEALRVAVAASSEANSLVSSLRSQLEAEAEKLRLQRESDAASKARLQQELMAVRGQLRASGEEASKALQRAHLAEQRVAVHHAEAHDVAQHLLQFVTFAEHEAAKIRGIAHEMTRSHEGSLSTPAEDASYDGKAAASPVPSAPPEDGRDDEEPGEGERGEGGRGEDVHGTQGLAPMHSTQREATQPSPPRRGNAASAAGTPPPRGGQSCGEEEAAQGSGDAPLPQDAAAKEHQLLAGAETQLFSMAEGEEGEEEEGEEREEGELPPAREPRATWMNRPASASERSAPMSPFDSHGCAQGPWRCSGGSTGSPGGEGEQEMQMTANPTAFEETADMDM